MESNLQCVRNIQCPFCCGDQKLFWTNAELLHHCEQCRDDKLGSKTLHFKSVTEFNGSKEVEEEATYTTYVKTQQTYKPTFCIRYCCLLLLHCVAKMGNIM